MAICQIDMFLYVGIGVWGKTKERKQHPPQGDDASTVSAATCRVGRDEQGEARPASSAPRGGPHLDLERLRLKTWSKSDLSIAETTGRTYLYIFTAGAQPIDTLFFSFAIRRCVAHVPVRSY